MLTPNQRDVLWIATECEWFTDSGLRRVQSERSRKNQVNPQSESAVLARRRELVDLGMIYDTGSKHEGAPIYGVHEQFKQWGFWDERHIPW